jgi:hypothetical protein
MDLSLRSLQNFLGALRGQPETSKFYKYEISGGQLYTIIGYFNNGSVSFYVPPGGAGVMYVYIGDYKGHYTVDNHLTIPFNQQLNNIHYTDATGRYTLSHPHTPALFAELVEHINTF